MEDGSTIHVCGGDVDKCKEIIDKLRNSQLAFVYDWSILWGVSKARQIIVRNRLKSAQSSTYTLVVSRPCEVTLGEIGAAIAAQHPVFVLHEYANIPKELRSNCCFQFGNIDEVIEELLL